MEVPPDSVTSPYMIFPLPTVENAGQLPLNAMPVHALTCGWLEATKLATEVVLAITSGAVPVASVEVICPVAENVVNAPVFGVVPPIAPGTAIVAPFREEAFRFATFVVLAMDNGAVPVASEEVICLVKLSVPVCVLFPVKANTSLN